MFSLRAFCVRKCCCGNQLYLYRMWWRQWRGAVAGDDEEEQRQQKMNCQRGEIVGPLESVGCVAPTREISGVRVQ